MGQVGGRVKGRSRRCRGVYVCVARGGGGLSETPFPIEAGTARCGLRLTPPWQLYPSSDPSSDNLTPLTYWQDPRLPRPPVLSCPPPLTSLPLWQSCVPYSQPPQPLTSPPLWALSAVRSGCRTAILVRRWRAASQHTSRHLRPLKGAASVCC